MSPLLFYNRKFPFPKLIWEPVKDFYIFPGENVTENNTDMEEIYNDNSDDEMENTKGDADMAQSYVAH